MHQSPILTRTLCWTLELGDSANKNSIRFDSANKSIRFDSIRFDSPCSKSRHFAVWWGGVLPERKLWNTKCMLVRPSAFCRHKNTPIKASNQHREIYVHDTMPRNGPLMWGVAVKRVHARFRFPSDHSLFPAIPSTPTISISLPPSSLKCEAVPTRCCPLLERIIIQFTLCWWEWQALIQAHPPSLLHHHYGTLSARLLLTDTRKFR